MSARSCLGLLSRSRTHPFTPAAHVSASQAGINVEKIDISVAARVLAQFSERLKPEQRVGDKLGELGEIVKTPNANVYVFTIDFPGADINAADE